MNNYDNTISKQRCYKEYCKCRRNAFRVYSKNGTFAYMGNMRPFTMAMFSEHLPCKWKDGKYHFFRYVGKSELSALCSGKVISNNRYFGKDHASTSRGVCFFTGRTLRDIGVWLGNLPGIVSEYALVEVIVDERKLRTFDLACGTYTAVIRSLSENYSTQIYPEFCCSKYGAKMGMTIRFAKIGNADLIYGKDILRLKWHTLK